MYGQTEKVETEEHFLLHCKKYDILRQIYFTKLQIYNPDFADMEHKEKIAILIGDFLFTLLLLLSVIFYNYSCVT